MALHSAATILMRGVNGGPHTGQTSSKLGKRITTSIVREAMRFHAP